MRIGINLLQIIPGEIGGIETYVRGVLKELPLLDADNEYLLLTNAENHEYYKRFEARNIRAVKSVGSSRNRLKRLAAIWFGLPVLAIRHDLRILFSPGNIAPPIAPCINVAAILDASYPECEVAGFYEKSQRAIYTFSAVGADEVVTISKSAARDITRFCRAKPEKIHIIYLGTGVNSERVVTPEEIAEVKKTFGLDRYALTLGALIPRKNYPALARAFSMVADRGLGLLIVGRDGPAKQEIEKAVNECGLSNRVKITGYFDGHLETLYKGAEFYIQPSIYEGFGLPVLEAMTLGVPVITSNASSLTEVGGDAVLYFNPKNILEMADRINKLNGNPGLKRGLSARGSAQAAKFSWTRCAREHVELFNSLGRRGRG
jgi:glycosyltransferase involved in cell wall biosynthesis